MDFAVEICKYSVVWLKVNCKIGRVRCDILLRKVLSFTSSKSLVLHGDEPRIFLLAVKSIHAFKNVYIEDCCKLGRVTE